jgi:hypothetical protein
VPYDDGISPFCSGSFDDDFVRFDAGSAISSDGRTSSMAEDASLGSCASGRTSKEAAGVEFRVEGALLVDLEGATSDAVLV